VRDDGVVGAWFPFVQDSGVARRHSALDFWCERFGFETTISVPLDGDTGPLGFAILSRDGVEVMLQTHASIKKDVGTIEGAAALGEEPNRAFLFIEVADIAAIEVAASGCEIVVPRRKTFYGADEIGVRAPGEHVVVFAEMTAQPAG